MITELTPAKDIKKGDWVLYAFGEATTVYSVEVIRQKVKIKYTNRKEDFIKKNICVEKIIRF